MLGVAKSSSAPGKVQFNVYLPTGLARAVRHRAIDEGRSTSAVVEAALTVYLRTVSAQTPSGLVPADVEELSGTLGAGEVR